MPSETWPSDPSPSEAAFDLTGKRVWVAGHRGMVGAALVRRLQSENCEIVTAGRSDVDLLRQEQTENWLETNSLTLTRNSTSRKRILKTQLRRLSDVRENGNHPGCVGRCIFRFCARSDGYFNYKKRPSIVELSVYKNVITVNNYRNDINSIGNIMLR